VSEEGGGGEAACSETPSLLNRSGQQAFLFCFFLAVFLSIFCFFSPSFARSRGGEEWEREREERK
jgi:hypothetical protein